MSEELEVGAAVRRRADPAIVGIVRSRAWNEQLEDWIYKVQFGLGTIGLPGDELEPLPETSDPWSDLAAGSLGDPDTLQRLLVVRRIQKPASRIAAAFGTARARVMPYQFKPLLKFLESQSQRLLIADDVGLGKTIEAGYVLRELRARTNLERVLVIVPARLREKWRNELERRFDERFAVVNRRRVLRELLEPIAAGRDVGDLQWIVSYESLRTKEVIEAFQDLGPAIDLTIVDEAHKARNPDTLQSRAVRAAVDCSTSALFLTATPIQTSLENLFNLLRILEPDTFQRFDVFTSQLDATRPVGRALAALRRSPPNTESARQELEQMFAREGAATRSFLSSLMQRLADASSLTRTDLVALQRDISELSPISYIMSRTRKVEVLPDRPVRNAQAVMVTMTEAERTYYDAVVDMCRAASTSSWGESMWALSAYRCAASCIPASVEYFRQHAREPAGEVSTLSAELEEESPWLEGDGQKPAPTGASVGTLLGRLLGKTPARFPVDSKFTAFRRALQEVWDEDRGAGRRQRKVVVFAFFKRTLSYVSQRLAAAGVQHERIDGDMPISEREDAMERFLNQPQLLVLLSSEVGSEGLDLQEASVVVNYDLPWNPMVVEQRIGRIDRIGQRSPTLSILNLTLKDTIEERILLRLYERIGVFKDTIGEIEEILGEQVQDLVTEALTGQLSPQDQERQADLTASAIVNERLQAHRLQTEAESLIAGDQAFLDEVEGLIGERKVPSAQELHRFIRGFLVTRYPGSQVPDSLVDDIGSLVVRPEIASDLNRHIPPDADVRRFIGRVQEGRVAATLDPEVYLKHPRAELLGSQHPLLRLACVLVPRDTEGGVRVFHADVPSPQGVVPGDYIVRLWHAAITGLRPRVELYPLTWSVSGACLLEHEKATNLYRALLDSATEPARVTQLSSLAVDAARTALDAEVQKRLAHLTTTEAGLARARATRRRLTLEGTLVRRVQAAEGRLKLLRERAAVHDFPLRMAERNLLKEQARLTAFRTETDESRPVVVEEETVALALVHAV